MLNTETGCIGRTNPYDMVLEIAQKHKAGWYLFNLMIQGYWGEVHGLFYSVERFATPQPVPAYLPCGPASFRGGARRRGRLGG
jgi:hypothetical protein